MNDSPDPSALQATKEKPVNIKMPLIVEAKEIEQVNITQASVFFLKKGLFTFIFLCAMYVHEDHL